MEYKNLIFLVGSLAACLVSPLSAENQKMTAIDEKIKELEEQRDFYLSKANRRDMNGMNWQSDSDSYGDSRRAYQLSEEDRKKAAEIQKQIDGLNTQKKQMGE